MVCHLDFIKGVGFKTLTKVEKNSDRGSKMLEIYNHQPFLAIYQLFAHGTDLKLIS